MERSLFGVPIPSGNVEYVMDSFDLPRPKRPRREYISVDAEGKPFWDMEKIFPDPERLTAFMRYSQEADESGRLVHNMHAKATRFPEWGAITDRPAEVVYYNEGGHPSCV